MMKMPVLFFLLFIAYPTYGQRNPVLKNCKTSGFDTMDLRHMAAMYPGKWRYTYTYYEDSCFIQEKPDDLPVKFKFYLADSEFVKRKLPENMYLLSCRGPFFRVFSKSGWGPFRKYSYPIANAYLRENNGPKGKLSSVIVQHFNRRGKFLTYWLVSMSNDTMVMFSGRYHEIRGKRDTHIYHVYRKQLKN